MKSRLKLFLFASPVLILLAMVFRPISSSSIQSSIVVNGTAERIAELGGPADIRIKLAGDNNIYYINRGAEQGLDAEALHEQLQGHSVQVHYADHWTPLDPFGSNRHVTRLTVDDNLLFDEIASLD